MLLQRQRLLLLRDHLRIRGERVSRIRIGNEGRGVRRLLLRFELGECIRSGIIHALLGINKRIDVLDEWKRAKQGFRNYYTEYLAVSACLILRIPSAVAIKYKGLT